MARNDCSFSFLVKHLFRLIYHVEFIEMLNFQHICLKLIEISGLQLRGFLPYSPE